MKFYLLVFSILLSVVFLAYGNDKVTCSPEHAEERNEIIEQSSCSAPKLVFVPLYPKAPNEQVSPDSVWLKRCVGLCEYVSAGSCYAKEAITRRIPIRVFNSETNKEYCETYPIEEHLNCTCIKGSTI